MVRYSSSVTTCSFENGELLTTIPSALGRYCNKTSPLSEDATENFGNSPYWQALAAGEASGLPWRMWNKGLPRLGIQYC
jgi:hypothetical protein